MYYQNEKGEWELQPHAYEKTLVALHGKTLIYIEGTNYKLSFNNEEGHVNNSFFGIAGSELDTQYGISFTKEQLLEIAENMKEGAKLKISSSTYQYDLKEIIERFEKDNNMIKIDKTSFKPKNLSVLEDKQ